MTFTAYYIYLVTLDILSFKKVIFELTMYELHYNVLAF